MVGKDKRRKTVVNLSVINCDRNSGGLGLGTLGEGTIT